MELGSGFGGCGDPSSVDELPDEIPGLAPETLTSVAAGDMGGARRV